MGSRLALLVVDVQEAAVAPDLFAGDVVLDNIARLIDDCRRAGVEVVFVQHDGRPGSDYEPDTPGWRIHGAVEPRSGERIVRKATNSAFRGTDLQSYLDGRGIDTLIVVGLHTEYCVDTTLRVAFELGYRLIVPELTNTTFDSGDLTGEEIYRHHNERIFRDRFATWRSLEAARETIAAAGARDT